jgi:AcrR family transcriptional regulator
MPRRAKINREQVLDAALQLIDDEGVEAVSMRRLGQQLGVEAMSLYNHVKDKGTLLQGVVERLLASVRPLRSQNWRRDIVDYAQTWRTTLSKHPRVGALLLSHPPESPSAAAHEEFVMSALSDPIPQALDRAYAFMAIRNYLLGDLACSYSSSVPRLAAAAGTAAVTFADFRMNSSPEVAFELGLNALLDGIERRSPF